MKRTLLHLAGVRRNHRVLDLGCGTGTLLVMCSRMHPDAQLVGIDLDPAVLQRARRKLRLAGSQARLELGSATDLPFSGGSFDRVVSTLVIHHLDKEEKRRAFSEIFRVLRSGGELHLADFGPPRGFLTRLASVLVEKLGGEHVHANYRGELPEMLRRAGLIRIDETWSTATIFGVIRALRGSKP